MNNFQKAQNLFATKSLLAGLILAFASSAFTSSVFANTDFTSTNTDSVTYNYVPADALKSSIENNLRAQQVDLSGLEIDVNDKGIVNVIGDVDSKQAADTITHVIKEKQGVYALYSELSYPIQ